MSRLARQPIPVTSGLSVKEEDGKIIVKGPKGEMMVSLLPSISITVEAEGIRVKGEGTTKQVASNIGTMWSLLKNALQGVSEGFSKILEIEGVGYKAVLEGKVLVLSLGYSQPVRYEFPESITILVEKSNVTISGINKEEVGQVAAEIRAYRKPEPYKGKGIHYRGEVIRRKVGKKAATASS
jgi:large subunit ribosomal protein L6